MAVRLRVKEVAREKGISMGKLHRQADVSYKTIKRIYSDPFYATITITLGKLAKVLGVPPGELIEETPDDIEEREKYVESMLMNKMTGAKFERKRRKEALTSVER